MNCDSQLVINSHMYQMWHTYMHTIHLCLAFITSGPHIKDFSGQQFSCHPCKKKKQKTDVTKKKQLIENMDGYKGKGLLELIGSNDPKCYE